MIVNDTDERDEDQFKDIPFIPIGLIEALRERFPMRIPELNDSERGIFQYAGYLKLIEFLAFVQAKQLQQQNNKEGRS